MYIYICIHQYIYTHVCTQNHIRIICLYVMAYVLHIHWCQKQKMGSVIFAACISSLNISFLHVFFVCNCCVNNCRMPFFYVFCVWVWVCVCVCVCMCVCLCLCLCLYACVCVRAWSRLYNEMPRFVYLRAFAFVCVEEMQTSQFKDVSCQHLNSNMCFSLWDDFRYVHTLQTTNHIFELRCLHEMTLDMSTDSFFFFKGFCICLRRRNANISIQRCVLSWTYLKYSHRDFRKTIAIQSTRQERFLHEKKSSCFTKVSSFHL